MQIVIHYEEETVQTMIMMHILDNNSICVHVQVSLSVMSFEIFRDILHAANLASYELDLAYFDGA